MKISPPLFASQTSSEHPEQCVAVDCQCSYCARNGLWLVHPLAEDVSFTHGEDERVQYLTGTMRANPFWFCGKCGSVLGVELMQETAEMMGVERRFAVNVSFIPFHLNMCLGLVPKTVDDQILSPASDV